MVCFESPWLDVTLDLTLFSRCPYLSPEVSGYGVTPGEPGVGFCALSVDLFLCCWRWYQCREDETGSETQDGSSQHAVLYRPSPLDPERVIGRRLRWTKEDYYYFALSRVTLLA